MQVHIDWWNHLPKEEQKEFEDLVLSSNRVLERLAVILQQRIEKNDQSSPRDYESSAWAYRQADKVGYRRALQEILKLTKFME